MEKMVLILIYYIFVTKKIFFWNEHNFKSGPIWIFFIKKDNDFINRRTNIFYGKQYWYTVMIYKTIRIIVDKKKCFS